MNKKLLLALLIPVFAFAQTKRISEQQAKQIASLETVATPIAAQNVLVCEPVDPPYSENFNTAVVPALPDCTTIQNVGTGNDFTTATNPGYGFSTNVLRYKWHTANPANAWFFTRGLNLVAGNTYNISYKYGSAGSTLYTEKLKVHIGMTASAAGMNPTPLIDHPLVNNNVTPITDNLQFTPDVTGVYYVGFNCYSNIDQFYLFVDDIAVSTNLAVNESDWPGFSYAPNPVRDLLNLSNGKNIDSVTIYNLLGQVIISEKVDAQTAQLNLSSLSKGSYFAEIASGKEVKTVTILKD